MAEILDTKIIPLEDDLLAMQLAAIIAGDIVHPYYDRVVKLANDYYAYYTGEGLDEMMERYIARESEDAFEQRKKLTEHIIPSVVGNITSVERKIPRSNGKNRIITYKDDANNKRTKDFEEILDKYWGTSSLDDWMATRWIELNDMDPNTFIVIEWSDFDGNKEKASPYPYEINAESAVMFEYINNILQFVVDQNDDVFTMYQKNQTIKAIPITDKDDLFKIAAARATEPGVLVDIDGRFFFKKTEKLYYLIIAFKPHNLGVVPAFRVGYKRDGVTDGHTYVSPYHDAVPYLRKTIKANSELDLTMALHAFPQKFITANKCAADNCNGGRIYKEGTSHECKECGGTGFKVHKSTQDIIYVPMPRNKDEQLELNNLALYVTPEVSLLEFQDQYIDKLTEECMAAVFNSDIFTTEEVSTTATEKRIDLDNIYDTLYPMSIQFSKHWKFQVSTISTITETDKGLIASLTFSKDFKFKSKDDYIRDRQAANDAGVPDIVLRNIDDEIVKIDTSENPMEYLIYKTQQSFDPFSGKTDEEIATILASNTVPLNIRVFYANMGWIFDEVAMENEKFYMLERKKQSKILDEKVKQIVSEIGTTTNPDFSG